MAQSKRVLPQRARRTLVPPTLTLALWQLRQVWGLLFFTCLGMIAAVVLADTVPLYTTVAMSAGARGALAASSQNSDIVVRSVSTKSSSLIDTVTQELNRKFQKTLGPYLSAPQFSAETQTFPVSAITTLDPGQGGSTTFHPKGDKIDMGLISAVMSKAAPHTVLLHGRLPADSGNTLEIAITSETAIALHADVGTILTVNANFMNGAQQTITRTLPLHIVGIFKLATSDDTFWHGNDFQSYQPNDFLTVYRGLISTGPLLSTLIHICNDNVLQNYVFQQPMSVIWYYHLDLSRVQASNLQAILNGITTVKVDNANNADLEQSPFLDQTVTYLPASTLEQYNKRIEIAQLPVTSLLWLMIGLILFFVSTMADLLVERQADAIAILRSRGASRRQVFGSLVMQGVGLSVLALALGSLLALPITRWLIQHSLNASDQGALNVLDGDPLPILLNVRIYALLAIGAALLAMIGAVIRSIGLDVLTVRRESARSTRRPLWQRWNLDILAIIISLIGFGISIYVSSAGILDPHSALVLLSPLTVLGSVFLLIASMLLLLRLFPLLLQGIAALLGRGRSAGPLLALAQMARAPRQPLRMTLLLALATAFAIFSLVCIASQSQRILDITAYQAGADFSGTIPVKLVTTEQLNDATQAYLRVQGVKAASLGYVKPASAGNSIRGAAIDFRAVDADTYAQAAIWTEQDSSQSLDSLMKQLVAQRQGAITHQLIPAIIDSGTANQLHLSQGTHFTLNFSLNDFADLLNFVVIEQIEHIPTATSNIGPGIMVDYRSFATLYKAKFASNSAFAVPVNTVWLHTVDDAAALSTLRSVIYSKGDLRLDSIYDRRAVITTLYREPLYLTLAGVLSIGALTALLLALIGNLLASWLNVRTRLTSFTILRALGATPGQVALALTWEQAFIYLTAILLGILFGLVFSNLVVPVLVFTSVTPSGITSDISNGAFYVAQSIPPIQVVMPATLSIALIALVVLCLVTLALMVRIVLRPSISTILRINED